MMNNIVIICGPTAVGKTSVGVKLCKRMGGEIVSADSQQVYCGMDIGTAKDDLRASGIPCHLVDVVDPDEPFDASKFKELADRAILDIRQRGKIPFVVGGTGFYIRVLIDGLCDAPERDGEIRAELMGIREKRGEEALYDILQREDPLMAERLHPNDISRVVRAIEVKRLTGKSLVEFQKTQRGISKDFPYNALKIGLNMERNLLYQRINERVDRMIERGLVEEVKGLVEKYGPDIQSLKAVGYKEIVGYLKKEITMEEAVRLTKQNTRRFAKRQLTWFRADSDIEWYKLKSEDKFACA